MKYIDIIATVLSADKHNDVVKACLFALESALQYDNSVAASVLTNAAMKKLCVALTYLMGIVSSVNSPTPETEEKPAFEKKDSTRSLIIRLSGFVSG